MNNKPITDYKSRLHTNESLKTLDALFNMINLQLSNEFCVLHLNI